MVAMTQQEPLVLSSCFYVLPDIMSFMECLYYICNFNGSAKTDLVYTILIFSSLRQRMREKMRAKDYNDK